ncbi:hypothetical protein QJS10_CPA10g01639 [Acorus calamus]|uniref:DUF4408 domain-containing protein n=1 Tax=Acorus calamus TaxID=4465 RepID=A0AAV9E1Y8_ACOCL|nr:hypothetical protein QJS10_CPA10g01639 [Acorus calamus]
MDPKTPLIDRSPHQEHRSICLPPRCLFVLCNAIIIFLVRDSRRGSPPDIYDEYLEHNKGLKRVYLTTTTTTTNNNNNEVVGVEEEREEEAHVVEEKMKRLNNKKKKYMKRRTWRERKRW